MVWDEPAQLDWDFEKYNIDEGATRRFIWRTRKADAGRLIPA